MQFAAAGAAEPTGCRRAAAATLCQTFPNILTFLTCYTILTYSFARAHDHISHLWQVCLILVCCCGRQQHGTSRTASQLHPTRARCAAPRCPLRPSEPQPCAPPATPWSSLTVPYPPPDSHCTPCAKVPGDHELERPEGRRGGVQLVDYARGGSPHARTASQTKVVTLKIDSFFRVWRARGTGSVFQH